jgi:hypothetical protein
MFQNLNQYFTENVLTEYKNYVKQRKNNKSGFSEDIKHGLRSASALFHFREHFPDELRLTRNQLEKICPNFKLLADVVNVSKHGTLDRNSPQVTDSKNIFEEIVSTTYFDNKGEFQHIQKEVITKLDSGEEVVLFELLTEIMNMWIDQLKSKGLFLELSTFLIYSKKLPRRNKNSGQLNILTNRSFYGRRFKLQKYNYDLKRIEPVDLTNANISMKFYKKTIPVEISIIPKDGNETRKIEMELTQREVNKIEAIKDKDRQLSELLKIARKKGLIEY